MGLVKLGPDDRRWVSLGPKDRTTDGCEFGDRDRSWQFQEDP